MTPFSAWRAAFDQLRRGRVDELAHIPERSRMWRVAEKLSTVELHRSHDDIPLDPSSLVGAPEDRVGRLFLGAYSEPGLVYALKEYGLWSRVAEVARDKPVLTIDQVGQSTQRFTITDGQGGPCLVEVKAGLRYGPDGDDSVAHDLPGPRDQPWLSMEWLLLQDPHRSFPPERPRLPGQKYPGLGVGREVMELMLISGWRLGCIGVVASPAWFHNAVMYRIHYRFVDPAEEGRFLALRAAWRDSGISLAQASLDMDKGRVVDGDGEVVHWRPGPIVAPLKAAGALEQDPTYGPAVDAARSAAQFRFPEPG